MLITRAVLDGILAGDLDRAYRRWKRPTVREGTVMRTAVGLVAVTSIRPTEEAGIGAADARRAGYATPAELLASIRPPDAATTLYEIGLRWVGEDPRVALRDDAALDADALADLRAALERMDRATADRPPARAVLELIDARPATLAEQLAAEVGMDKPRFKGMVRRLKELGLTESLRVGYRLSPRGRAFLDAPLEE